MSSSQTLPPPQGPEYTPCGCSHIEPEHRPDAGACLTCGCGAYRPAPAVPAGQAPATDQTTLRERLGAEMARADGWDWAGAAFSTLDTPGANRYRKLADAVLAALPASVDRAAVLREEAALIRAHCPDHLDADSAEGAWMDCHCPVADDMERRLAAASAVVVRRATDETPDVRHTPGITVLCPDCRAKGHAVCMDGEACGRTKSVAGVEYPPCARPAGHPEAYCRSADGKQHFLAVLGPRPAATPPAVGAQQPKEARP